MKGMSKRQVELQFGFNTKLVETLLDQGVLKWMPGGTPLRQKIDPVSLGNLHEGEHYVVCRSCGAFQALITIKHLRSCSGLTLAQYEDRFPDTQSMSNLASVRRARTEEQRIHQSDVLKVRFQTEAGKVTRQQISDASKRMMANGYYATAAEYLRKMSRSPERRAKVSQQMKDLYATGRNPAKEWHANHVEESRQGAAEARRHIKKKRTRPHLQLKDAMVAGGLDGFLTEYEVGYYAIDEARPDIKLAVEMDGCYYHGCADCGLPGLAGNRRIDKAKTTCLTNRGWTMLRVRECEVKRDLVGCVERIRLVVQSLSQKVL